MSVQDRTDATGMRYHWDKWSNGCGSQYRDWDTSQPNGGIGYYDFEDQNCVVMGFFKRPQWWDVRQPASTRRLASRPTSVTPCSFCCSSFKAV